ncbi:MAG: hypothetical protein JSU70_16300 [Phycisphaerales bacterium]|nr:MAG: hypothetical protein JSU70_16300 [Phycisphaerales bacterium]
MPKAVVPFSVALAMTLQSCGPHGDTWIFSGGEVPIISAEVTNIRGRPSKLFCDCDNIVGRDLVFDLTVTNKSARRQAVYAFIWFTTKSTSPPERALWPSTAVKCCLTPAGELNVTDPGAGKKIDVPGRGSFTEPANAILQPIGYYEDRLIGFDELRIELWTEAENRIFSKTVGLK